MWARWALEVNGERERERDAGERRRRGLGRHKTRACRRIACANASALGCQCAGVLVYTCECLDMHAWVCGARARGVCVTAILPGGSEASHCFALTGKPAEVP